VGLAVLSHIAGRNICSRLTRMPRDSFTDTDTSESSFWVRPGSGSHPQSHVNRPAYVSATPSHGIPLSQTHSILVGEQFRQSGGELASGRRPKPKQRTRDRSAIGVVRPPSHRRYVIYLSRDTVAVEVGSLAALPRVPSRFLSRRLRQLTGTSAACFIHLPSAGSEAIGICKDWPCACLRREAQLRRRTVALRCCCLSCTPYQGAARLNP